MPLLQWGSEPLNIGSVAMARRGRPRNLFRDVHHARQQGLSLFQRRLSFQPRVFPSAIIDLLSQPVSESSSMMPFYTPTPSPPRIIVTEHDGDINTVHVPWNRNVLAVIWIPQFFFLLLGMAVLPYDINDVLSFPAIFVGLITMGNVLLISTPLMEAHHYGTGNLNPRFFHRLQAYKATWVGGSMVIMVLIQAGSSYDGAWRVMWAIVADGLYLAPFAAGVWYAQEMKKETSSSKDGGEDVETGNLRL